MKDIKITKDVAKIIVFVILYVIILGAFLFFVAKPIYEQIKSVNSEILKQEERLALLKTAKEKINTIKSDIDYFEERIETLKKVLPVEDQELLYVQEFIIIANSCNVKIANITFPKSSSKEQTNAKKFTINVNSTKLEYIMYFIGSIKENYPQITELNLLSIQKITPTTSTKTTTETLPYSSQIQGIIYLSQRKW